MSLHRAMLAAFAALFVAGTASSALAGCCGFGPPAPVAYVPPPVYAAPCGGCVAPVAAPVTYGPPVALVPVAAPAVLAAPVASAAWGIRGCGCGAAPAVYAAPPVVMLPPPIVPAPIYVVDQGPAYTGPGIMVSYRTWSPAAAFVPAIGFPYVPPAYRRYGLPRRHYASYAHPRHYWRRYPYRPLRARD